MTRDGAAKVPAGILCFGPPSGNTEGAGNVPPRRLQHRLEIDPTSPASFRRPAHAKLASQRGAGLDVDEQRAVVLVAPDREVVDPEDQGPGRRGVRGLP